MTASNNPQTASLDSNLRRHIHDTYTIPRVNYVDWVLSNYQWRGNERLLDVGCGHGAYYDPLMDHGADLQYYGLDIEAGVLIEHPHPSGRVLADAQYIPFPDNSFDVIMANHMVYHVQNIDQTLAEFHRVLKPGGCLIGATNSVQNMPELQVLMRRAILLLAHSASPQIQPPIPASDNFALENGTRYLARYFYAVARYDLPSKLVFPEIEPVMEYIESTRPMREPQLPSDVDWEDVMMIMRQQITHLINHLGELAINKLAGVLVASDNGGVIQEF